ncbi:ribonuclease HI family protein [Desulfogranum japonicum]|uniref:ribonuclease HI family protein n=1 Tax=Desulfogranum japonicum TaxID=231447 RepID=UPI000425EFF4|nr:ribonuclease HI family protein [Desulfogranum japonicum]
MITDPPGRETILRTLAEKLDDSTIKSIFPGAAPEIIRAQIAGKPLSRGIQPSVTEFNAGATADVCRLFTDGASRGNPGHAGAGISICSPEGDEISCLSTYLGQCTNNVAEYKALLLGLEHARKIGCIKLDVFLDSELIVKQINGLYKVKNASLKPLYTKVVELLNHFASWSVSHVPRAQNARADALANQGIDHR